MNTSLAKLSLKYFENLKNNELISITNDDEVKAYCQTVFHLDNQFDLTAVRKELLAIYNNYYKNSSLSPAIREACCAFEQIER